MTPSETELTVPDPKDLPAGEPNVCATPGDDLAPNLVVIPPGQFPMGSPENETDRRPDEGPQQWVTIQRPFALGRCEVTRGQYRKFAEETGYRTTVEEKDGCYTWDEGTKNWRQDPARNWRNPGFEQIDMHPVVCVSYRDVEAYIAWLVARTGAPYRLPIEAEWEYAARAGTLTSRYWGDDPNLEEACAFANVADRQAAKINPSWQVFNCDDRHPFTSPAGTFRPNHFGLYDMLGNVWEWTEDCYHDNYAGAPTDGSAWLEAKEGQCGRRVVRGGSWDIGPQYLRSAYRGWSRPVGASDSLGFRLARDL